MSGSIKVTGDTAVYGVVSAPRSFCSLPGSLSHSTIDAPGWTLLGCGIVLCIVECLTALLASTH